MLPQLPEDRDGMPGSARASSLVAVVHRQNMLLEALVELAPQTYDAVREGSPERLDALVERQEALVGVLQALPGREPFAVARAPVANGQVAAVPELGSLLEQQVGLVQQLAALNQRTAALLLACMHVLDAEMSYLDRVTSSHLYQAQGNPRSAVQPSGGRLNEQA